MSEEFLDENEDVETPLTGEQLMANLLTDIVTDEDPEILASDFVENFVLNEQPETAQILAMLEAPTQSLLELVKAALQQSFQAQMEAVNDHGIQYLDGLKAAVKKQMTELAE